MPSPLELSREDQDLVNRVARMIVRRRLTTPAIMFLETGRPFNFVASQFLAFLSPFATLLLKPTEYKRFVTLLEHRQGIDVLLTAIADEADRVAEPTVGEEG